ncbi:MAG: hypothetical protein JJT94_04495 [Bernardetiaceae bacterium]|nr:hypothetical protein [Bernardetiaceae bacterium]
MIFSNKRSIWLTFLLFGLFGSWITPIKAQQELSVSQEFEVLIPIAPQDMQPAWQSVIKTIADSQQVAIQELNWQLLCEVQTELFVANAEENAYQLRVFFDIKGLAQSAAYRNFETRDLLIPDYLEVKLYGKKGEQEARFLRNIKVNTSELNLQKVKDSTIELSAQWLGDAYHNEAIYFFVPEQEVSYIFSENSALLLQRRIQFIDNYYLQSTTLDALRTLLSQLERKVKTKDGVDKLIAQIDQQFESLYYYREDLPLQASDPILLLKKTSELQAIYADLRKQINPQEQELYLQYYEEGLKRLQSDSYSSSEAALEFRKAADLQYAPASLQLARIDYFQGNFASALSRLQELKQYADADDDTIETGLAAIYNDIYAYYFRLGKQAANNLDFEDAQRLYAEAAAICEQNPIPENCKNELENKQQEVRDFYIEYLLSQARGAVQMKGFVQSRAFMEKAVELAMQNKEEDYAHLIDTYNFFQQSVSDKVDEFVKSKDYKKAYSYLNLMHMPYDILGAVATDLTDQLRMRKNKNLMIYAIKVLYTTDQMAEAANIAAIFFNQNPKNADIKALAEVLKPYKDQNPLEKLQIPEGKSKEKIRNMIE